MDIFDLRSNKRNTCDFTLNERITYSDEYAVCRELKIDVNILSRDEIAYICKSVHGVIKFF